MAFYFPGILARNQRFDHLIGCIHKLIEHTIIILTFDFKYFLMHIVM